MDGHLPNLGWLPTNLRMFTTSPRMVTHQKEMYYRLQIGHLNITYETNQVAAAMHSHLSSLLVWLRNLIVHVMRNKNLPNIIY